jgi:hypothetical protein
MYGCLCCGLPGLCILACPTDEKDAYAVDNKVYDAAGDTLVHRPTSSLRKQTWSIVRKKPAMIKTIKKATAFEISRTEHNDINDFCCERTLLFYYVCYLLWYTDSCVLSWYYHLSFISCVKGYQHRHRAKKEWRGEREYVFCCCYIFWYYAWHWKSYYYLSIKQIIIINVSLSTNKEMKRSLSCRYWSSKMCCNSCSKMRNEQ